MRLQQRMRTWWIRIAAFKRSKVIRTKARSPYTAKSASRASKVKLAKSQRIGKSEATWPDLELITLLPIPKPQRMKLKTSEMNTTAKSKSWRSLVTACRCRITKSMQQRKKEQLLSLWKDPNHHRSSNRNRSSRKRHQLLRAGLSPKPTRTKGRYMQHIKMECLNHN